MAPILLALTLMTEHLPAAETRMPDSFESWQSADSADQPPDYVDYLARQMAPMIRALMLVAAVAFGIAVIATNFIRPSTVPLLLRLLPVPLLLLAATVARRVQRPRSLSLLALTCVLLLEIGINLSSIGRLQGQPLVLPGLLLPVASAMIWFSRRDFVVAMTLCVVGPLPMLLLGTTQGVQIIQYFVYMAIAISLSTVLRAFMARTLFEQFRLERQLREQANTDGLTGLLLRNRFLELAQLALDIHSQQKPVCMLFVDADHFKQLNDDYGHAAGDNALVALAAALRTQLRQTDLIGRIGGEEFVILLPGLNLQQARERAEQLRLAIRTVKRPDGRLTVSIGAAEYRQGDTVDALLARADQAMRQAKRGGRDRIVSAIGN
jgi:diguanylate cyclase (GGDEF)-like protein